MLQATQLQVEITKLAGDKEEVEPTMTHVIGFQLPEEPEEDEYYEEDDDEDD